MAPIDCLYSIVVSLLETGPGVGPEPSGRGGAVVKPLAQPLSHSITGRAERLDRGPEFGQPSELPVPGDSECTTAKRRGTQVSS